MFGKIQENPFKISQENIVQKIFPTRTISTISIKNSVKKDTKKRIEEIPKINDFIDYTNDSDDRTKIENRARKSSVDKNDVKNDVKYDDAISSIKYFEKKLKQVEKISENISQITNSNNEKIINENKKLMLENSTLRYKLSLLCEQITKLEQENKNLQQKFNELAEMKIDEFNETF